MSPLEPMKLRAATCSNDTENKTQKATIDVPAAQFDWNSSGLINPLDGMNTIFFNSKQHFHKIIINFHCAQKKCNSECLFNLNWAKMEITKH